MSSNVRKASLQKCMYINDETPHRDPTTIFHSPFNKGAKSISYNNPSYMSSEVFYPHQQNSLTQVNFARTPKRSFVQDNNTDQYSNSKSPMRPPQSTTNKSQTKYSYINDYQKFLERQEQQSETKSHYSQTNNSYSKNNLNQNGSQGNKTYHFNNKSMTSPIEVGFNTQNTSTTPKNAKNIQQQLNNIVNQDTTATTNKNRSHSHYDIGDIKKKIDLENSQKERSGYQTPNDQQSQKSTKSNLSIQNPSSLIKLEQVKNNQKIISQSTKNAYPLNSDVNGYRSQTPQNVVDQNNNQSYTPKSHSRNSSQIFYFPNQQKQQEYNQQNQYQYDQLSNTSSQKNNSSSKGNFKLIKSPQNLVKNALTTHQQHYNSLSKSPTPKNFNKTEEVRAFNDPNGQQQNQVNIRNASTTPKRVIDLTSNQSTKGSNSNPISQSGAIPNDKQSNFGDDAKSVSSSQSYISQLVCTNCVNKDLIVDKQIRQQKDKERQAQLEKQALENEKANHYNMYMHQLEQNVHAKNQYNKEVQEQLEYKNAQRQQEQEREKNQRRIEQQQFQEEQDRVYRQKLDDLKNYREQYKKDIELQIKSKQERKEKEKNADISILASYAAQQEQDLHNFMNLITQKQYQTSKVREELQNQLLEKKKIQEQKAQEELKYKQQLDQQLAYDLKIKEQQVQQRQEELRQFKDAWDQQQQHKQQQHANQQRENEKIKRFQEDQLENDRQKYIYNLEKNEYIKKSAAEDLKNQIDIKKHQQQMEFEEKQKYGQQLKEQYERDLAQARSNYHDCDRCHASVPTTHLTKKKLQKSKPKFKV